MAIKRSIDQEIKARKKEIGKRLYRLIKSNSMTYERLSEATGISFQSLLNYGSGKANPSINNLILICYTLDCKIEVLFNNSVVDLKEGDSALIMNSSDHNPPWKQIKLNERHILEGIVDDPSNYDIPGSR